MEWLRGNEPIPVDEHRWIILYTHTGETPYTVEKALNNKGLEVSFVQQLNEVEGVTIPPSLAWIDPKPYYGLVEPKIRDLTADILKKDLQSPALLASRQPIPAVMEIAFDAQEVAVGDEVIPVRFLKEEEKIPRGNKWYMTTASWSSRAPSMAKISSVLSGMGIVAYQPPTFGNSANPNLQTFVLTPGSTNPTIADIRKAIGAVMLLVNSYSSESDVDFLKKYEGTGDEFVRAVAEFGGEVAQLTTQVVKSGKNLAEVGKGALKVTDILLWVAIPTGVGLLGYWGYTKFKGVKARAK